MAGFIEGEGNFYSTPRKVAQYRLNASQKQREPLERLQTMFGGTIWEHKTGGYHQWSHGGIKALEASLEIFPLLSPRRKSQFDKALARWEHVYPEGHR